MGPPAVHQDDGDEPYELVVYNLLPADLGGWSYRILYCLRLYRMVHRLAG